LYLIALSFCQALILGDAGTRMTLLPQPKIHSLGQSLSNIHISLDVAKS
jgi:hypothetical protein